MNKNFYLVAISAMVLLFSNSCGKSSAQLSDTSAFDPSVVTEQEENKPEPEDIELPKSETSEPETSEPETSESETSDSEENTEPEDGTAAERTRARIHHAYAEVLSAAYYGHVLPDESPLATVQTGEQDRFSIVDLNGDGEEELILYCNTESAYGMVTYVWNYNTETKELTEHFGGFSPLTFYSDGLVKQESYMNNSMDTDFPPYTIYQYEKSSNSYTQIYDSEGSDQNDPEAWRQEILGSASPIEIPWEELTSEAIMACVRPQMEFIKEDIRKSFSDTDLALLYMDGEVDAVQLYLEENGGVSFDNRDEVFYVGTWKGQEVLMIDYEDATSFTYLAPIDGVTTLGLMPGMKLKEAASVLETLGFSLEEGNELHYVTGLGIGNYGISLEIENDTVVSVRFQFECKYIG